VLVHVSFWHFWRQVERRRWHHQPSKEGQIVVSIALICTARRRIPVSASTNQGPKPRRFDQVGEAEVAGLIKEFDPKRTGSPPLHPGTYFTHLKLGE